MAVSSAAAASASLSRSSLLATQSAAIPSALFRTSTCAPNSRAAPSSVRVSPASPTTTGRESPLWSLITLASHLPSTHSSTAPSKICPAVMVNGCLALTKWRSNTRNMPPCWLWRAAITGRCGRTSSSNAATGTSASLRRASSTAPFRSKSVPRQMRYSSAKLR